MIASIAATVMLAMGGGCAEDRPCFVWPTMGNHRRGVVLYTGERRTVGPCTFRRLLDAGRIDPYRTPTLKGDWLAFNHGCDR